MKKTIIALLNSSVLLASLAAPAFASTYNVSGNSGSVNITDNSTTNVTNNITNIKFTDLGNYDWAKKAIQDMTKQKLINGMGNGKFSPEKEVTRAQFAVLVYRMFKLIEPDNTVQYFADVPPKLQNRKPNWAFKAINAVGQYFDLTTDFTNTDIDFNPDQPMTREEAAVVIVKIMNKEGRIQLDSTDQVQKVLQDYEDKSYIPDASQPYVATAISYGLMEGVGGMFEPTRNIIRAEAAVLLERIKAKLTNVPEGPLPPQPVPTIQPMPPVPAPTDTTTTDTTGSISTGTQTSGSSDQSTDQSATNTQPTSNAATTVSNDTYSGASQGWLQEGPAGGAPVNP